MLIALTILLAVLVAASLSYVLYRTGITRVMVFWPSFLYIATCALFPGLWEGWRAQLSVLCFMPIYPYLQSVHTGSSNRPIVFYLTLLMLLGSLATPALVCYIPLFWLLMIYTQTFSLRVLLASLLAICVFLIWYTLAIYQWDCRWVYTALFDLRPKPSSFLEYYTLILDIAVMLGALIMTAKNLWRIGRSGTRRRIAIHFSTLSLLLGAVIVFTLPGDMDAIIIYPFTIITILFTTRNL